MVVINVYMVFGGINMKEKEITINVMIKLLELAKNHPLFCVSYYIVAKNNEIETWIRKRVNRFGWDGKELNEEDIVRNEDVFINDFHESQFYDECGESKILISQCFSLSDIGYDKIHTIVSGKSDNLPNGYKFIGDVELFNFSKLSS